MSDKLDKIEEIFISLVGAALFGKSLPDLSNLSEKELDKLFDLAVQQNLICIIYHIVSKNIDLSKYRNKDRYAVLSMKLMARQKENTESFISLYRSMKAAGIVPLVFKGLSCRILYGEYENFRISGDEDILIPRDEFEKAKEVLEMNGFHIINKISEGFDFSKIKEVTFVKEKSFFKIDLHFSIITTGKEIFDKMGIFMDDAAEKAVWKEVHGEKILMLDPTHHFLHLVFHAATHFSGYGMGLRHLLDIAVSKKIYAREIDRELIERALAETGLSRFFWDLEDIERMYLGSSEEKIRNPGRANCLLKDMLKDGIFGTDNLDPSVYISKAFATRSVPEEGKAKEKKWRIILGAAFPPASYFAPFYPNINKHPCLIAVLWMKRWMKLFMTVIFTLPFRKRGKKEMQKVHLSLLEEYGII